MVLDFLSYGGGVQSTAMILLAIEGKLELPDFVVFADTGSEMPHTYELVEQVKQICADAQLPFETVKASQPLHEGYFERGGLPVIGIRSCTSKWKIEPINRFMRSKVGMGRGKVLVNTWIGITTDERRRATPSSNQWTARRYPLLELHMSRDDCIHYLKLKGIDAKKSGCFLCPYQHAHQWSRLKRDHPDLFAIALSMEKKAKLERGFKGGLWGSSRSIEAFNFDSTLEDYGFDLGVEAETCAVAGSCFL
ncbi:MAG TPA: hypothetical protein EYN66_09205 [Myxococcales bacterium]|nr:hypothetical protein [Myxococcales bacterium]